MQPAMKNLMTRLTACSSPEEGTAILVQGIAGAIKRAGTDETKLANLHDDLKTNANAWAGAQVANLGEASADIAQDATAADAAPATTATKGRLNGNSKGSLNGAGKVARQATNGTATNGAAAAPAGTPQPGATAKATPAIAAAASKRNGEQSKGRARKAA